MKVTRCLLCSLLIFLPAPAQRHFCSLPQISHKELLAKAKPSCFKCILLSLQQQARTLRACRLRLKLKAPASLACREHLCLLYADTKQSFPPLPWSHQPSKSARLLCAPFPLRCGKSSLLVCQFANVIFSAVHFCCLPFLFYNCPLSPLVTNPAGVSPTLQQKLLCSLLYCSLLLCTFLLTQANLSKIYGHSPGSVSFSNPKSQA